MGRVWPRVQPGAELPPWLVPCTPAASLLVKVRGRKEMRKRWQPDLGHAKPGGKGLSWPEAGERDSQVGRRKEADVPVDLRVERCF